MVCWGQGCTTKFSDVRGAVVRRLIDSHDNVLSKVHRDGARKFEKPTLAMAAHLSGQPANHANQILNCKDTQIPPWLQNATLIGPHAVECAKLVQDPSWIHEAVAFINTCCCGTPPRCQPLFSDITQDLVGKAAGQANGKVCTIDMLVILANKVANAMPPMWGVFAYHCRASREEEL